MSGGGGKGGETQQSIDPRLAAASAKVLERADAASKIPYSPNRGVTIAAFTPQQEAAMANASAAAEAFGMEGGGSPSMPTPETSATGIRGYSTGAEYDDMVAKSLSPELQAAINKFFSVKGGPGTAKTATNNAGKKASTFGLALSNTLGLNQGNSKPRDYFGDGK